MASLKIIPILEVLEILFIGFKVIIIAIIEQINLYCPTFWVQYESIE